MGGRPKRQTNSRLLVIAIAYAVGLYLLQRRLFETGWSPLLGSGDTEVSEHQGYYFLTHLRWWPFPHLQLVSDSLFYPFGIFTGFQAWVPEREYLFAALTALFGPGPWLQIYCLLSFLLTGLVACFWIRKEYGRTTALVFLFALTFFNFYALHKFPFHGNMVALHWLTLSLIYDHLWYRDRIRTGCLSLRPVLLRLILVLLSLGIDLSYLAGISLTSFVVTSIFIARDLDRSRRQEQKTLSTMVRELADRWRTEFRTHRPLSIAMTAAILVLAWFYVPLCAHIFFEARRYSPINGVSFWANPLRLVIPWLPDFLGWDKALLGLFHDRPETPFDMRVGATLVLPAIYAAFYILKNKLRVFYPTLVFLFLLLTFHPNNFPLIRLLPWFGMSRVAGRFSTALPCLSLILCLAVPWRLVFNVRYRPILAAWIVLAAIEIPAMYRALGPTALIPMSEELRSFMSSTRALPGTAVLDWPFCINSGNAVRENLCPRPNQTVGDFTLQRFHHKKVVGLNLGRLTREMTSPYWNTGWGYLLETNERHECFDAEQWKFFEDFVRYYGFSAVILHSELLPENCVHEFHRRFGEAIASAKFPFSGRSELIPIPLDSTAERSTPPRIAPPLPEGGLEVVHSDDEQILMDGLEPVGEDKFGLRGVESSVSFQVDRPRTLVLHAVAETPLVGQVLQIHGEANDFAYSIPLPSDRAQTFDLTFVARPGVNRIAFRPTRQPNSWDVAYRILRWVGGEIPNLRELGISLRKNKNVALTFSSLRIGPLGTSRR